MLSKIASYSARSSTGGGTFFHHLRLLKGAHAPPPPRLFLLFSSAAAGANSTDSKGPKWATTQRRKNPSFIAEYLVRSCGFSRPEAVELSKHLAHLRSPENPDSVLSFLRERGFDDVQVRKLVSSKPVILCIDVEKYLKPKIRALEEMGLSGSALLEVVRFNNSFIHASLQKKLMPNISLLLECGIPESRISTFVQGSRCLITRSVDSLKELVRRTEELGVARGSPMFKYALSIVSKLSKSTLENKLAHCQSLGWTEGETLSVIQKCPGVLRLSEDKLRRVVDFLVKKVGYTPSFIAAHPIFFTYSLEKRMVPRYNILQVLERKSLLRRKVHFTAVLKMNEQAFLSRFILPHADEIPGLCEAYDSACKGKESELMSLAREIHG